MKEGTKDILYGVVILFACAIIYIVIVWFTNFRWEQPNLIGDSAGAANGLFSALAFAGVIYAIILQRKELKLQREELKLTREEMSRQSDEFKDENKTLRLQRFENTFFNMMQLHQQIVDNITFSYEEYDEIEAILFGASSQKTEILQVKGRAVFRDSFEKPGFVMRKPGTEFDGKYKGMRELIKNFGLEGYETNDTPAYFDHYFRHLYRIIKFIATSPLLEKEQERYEYTSIVRSQLSRYELVWLYYNGLSSYGRDKFKPYIERFGLLQNIRKDLLIAEAPIEHEYSASAFRRDHALNQHLSQI